MLVAAACGGGSNIPVIATTTIGPAGGVVGVPGGEIAGARVSIPPGALERPTPIGISSAIAPAVPGFVTIGPGVVFEPLGTGFDLPATITLPFDKTVLLNGVASVLALDQAGQVVELAPVAIPSPGFATVDVASLSMAFVTERFLGGVATIDYLPLQSGNEWNFENGAKITATFSFAEPNLGGSPVLVFLLQTADDNLGLYLRQVGGATELLGEFQNAGSEDYQQLHDPTVFLPTGVTIDRPVLAAFEYARYVPYGATAAALGGMARTGLLPEVAPDVTTAVGTFSDVIKITMAAAFGRANGQELELPYSLTLARDVGPVGIEVLGFETVLQSGIVDGNPIEGVQ